MTTHVSTFLRVRPVPTSSSGLPPLNPPSSPSIQVSSTTLSISRNRFSYADGVIQGVDQISAMSNLCGPLMGSIRDGDRNATLVAYGQTGSGKTYTLFGKEGSLTTLSLEKASGGRVGGWGVIPTVMIESLDIVGGGKVRVSAKEVYGNKCYDLLDSLKPLSFSSTQNTGVSVGHGNISLLDGRKSYGGTHPPGCRCGDCWKAQEAVKKERIEKRNSGAFGKGGSSIRKMSKTGNEVEFKVSHGRSDTIIFTLPTNIHLLLTRPLRRSERSWFG